MSGEPANTVTTRVEQGRFRTRTWTAQSGNVYVELLYQPAEDHPGYPMWEPVKDFPDLASAEAFIKSPPAWWRNDPSNPEPGSST